MSRRPTTFLARETYRRRRVIDAIRLLPFVAALLFLAPLLGAGATERATALTGFYLFAIWFCLILGTALLVRGLARTPGGIGPDPLETGGQMPEDEG